MSLRLSGLNPLAYMGVEPTSPALFITQTDSPTVNDWQNFNVGTVWLNTTTGVPYMLVSLASNQATWIPLGSSADISTLMGNSGTASGNIITVTTGADNAQGTALFTGDDASTLSLTFSDGNNNTGIGLDSLSSGALTGNYNSSFGTNTLSDLTSGANNVAIGSNSLTSLTSGVYNIAIGKSALFASTDGSFNTAVGGLALGSLTTGGSNIAIGDDAGDNYTSSESSNILIGNAGVLSESHTIHIGTQGSSSGEQNTCYIAGIYGNTGFTGSPTYVGIDSSGYLGVLSGGGSGGATNFITNSGDAAVDGSGNISIVGTTNNITTAASTNTVTINVGSHVATSFTTDDSTTINPSSGNIIVHGTGNVSTSSSGHTITIAGSGGGASTVNVYTTLGSNTWNKLSGTNFVAVYGWGGGGGGASGARNSPGTIAGGGGAPTSCFCWVGPAYFFGSSETAFVGSGGAGGAAATSDSNLGNNGSAGTASYFGNIKPPAFPWGLNGGMRIAQTTYGAVGGQFFNFFNGSLVTGAGSGGNLYNTALPPQPFRQIVNTPFAFQVGGVYNVTISTPGNGSDIGGIAPTTLGSIFTFFFPTAGGAGGASASSPSISTTGGRGGNVNSIDGGTILTAGGAGGATGVNGSAGNNAPMSMGLIYGGTGGGGGGGDTESGPGNGGAGGFPGGGGGGGGSSFNGTNSGAGGNGANGLIIVVQW